MTSGAHRTPTRAAGEAPRLGRYRVFYRIAQGGMASVYLARTETPVGYGRWVALKVIHPNIAADPRFVGMFHDEARLATQLDHPSLCTVFDFGEHDGTYFLAMEYLHGETLGAVARRAWRSQGSLPLELCVRVIADAARGLHAAHEMRNADGSLAHVVHRDVSPENVFVTYAGTTKIVDFGVARSDAQVHDRTATGELKGKLAYMSPEQLQERDIDRRTDVWALGVVLWEITVGRRLFRRQTDAQTVFAITRDPITRPSRLREHYPPALEAIVMRALERDRDRRYATALDLARALEAWLTAATPTNGTEVGEFMQALFAEQIAWRDQYLRRTDDRFEDLMLQWQSSPRTSSVDVPDAHTVAMGPGIPGSDSEADPPTRRVESPLPAPRTSDPDDLAAVIPLTRRADTPRPPPPEALAPLARRHGNTLTPAHTPAPVLRDIPPVPIVAPPRRRRLADYATITALFVMGGVMAHIWYDTPRATPTARPRPTVAPRRAPAPVVAPLPVAPPAPVVAPTQRSAPAPTPARTAPRAPVMPRAHRDEVIDDGTRRVEGYLTITASSPSSVYIGDRLLGRTPLERVAMSPGVYALRVVTPGTDGERQVLVTLRPGALTISHVPATGEASAP